MFQHIPQPILDRMDYLQAIDAGDRRDGTPRTLRLRQIPPETGRFLAVLAASAPPGQLLEVGTSACYSGLWLSLACRLRGTRLTTFEVDPEKVKLAQATFRQAEVVDIVDLVHADARQRLPGIRKVTFCFMDCDKELYGEVYDLVIPNMVSGGIFTADNALSHQDELAEFLDRALSDPRLDALVVPVGRGILLGRRTEAKLPYSRILK